jgi:hypothetical protein
MRPDYAFPSVVDQAFQLSPEAAKAQKEAELRDLAEWRARHLKEIIAWSDPVKREAKKALAKQEEEFGRGLLDTIPSDLLAVRTGKSLSERVTIREIFKASPKGWFDRVLDWIKT